MAELSSGSLHFFLAFHLPLLHLPLIFLLLFPKVLSLCITAIAFCVSPLGLIIEVGVCTTWLYEALKA